MIARPRASTGKFTFADISGCRFGRLLVIDLAEKHGTKNIWRCRCDCGNTKLVDISNLRGKHNTRSCGCYRRDMAKNRIGAKHPGWKGGRVLHKGSGYIMIHKPEHPHVNKTGYVCEHRAVMEQHIGRYLFPDETICSGHIGCRIRYLTGFQVTAKNAFVSYEEPDNKPANKAAEDRGESQTAMEPLVLTDGSRHRPGLSDLALELTAASAGFRRSLPPGVRQRT